MITHCKTYTQGLKMSRKTRRSGLAECLTRRVCLFIFHGEFVGVQITYDFPTTTPSTPMSFCVSSASLGSYDVQERYLLRLVAISSHFWYLIRPHRSSYVHCRVFFSKLPTSRITAVQSCCRSVKAHAALAVLDVPLVGQPQQPLYCTQTTPWKRIASGRSTIKARTFPVIPLIKIETSTLR